MSATQRLAAVCQLPSGSPPKVGLDTCCVEYYLGNPPKQPWADCLDPLFQAAVNGHVELYVSTVVVSELLAHRYYASRNQAGYDPELDLLAILDRHFEVLDVNGDVARAAGRLRGTYLPGDKITLKTPDVLIGATSVSNAHAMFVTNDADLAEALQSVNCLYLRDIALEWLAGWFPASCLAGTHPIMPAAGGVGLPGNPTLVSSELGSIRPDPSASWQRILADALNVAAAVNVPCLFFVLSEQDGGATVTQEVLYWHDGLNRVPKKMVQRLHDHLGYSLRGTKSPRQGRSIHTFFCSSIARARAFQTTFASRSAHKRESEAWNSYLRPLWEFREALRMPQTTWLFCEDGVARSLNAGKTADAIVQAANVLGWKEER
jgi:predicted nucleic acid-binding protein